MATVETKTYMPEDLLAMPEGARFELVEGQLVERNVSLLSSWVAGRMFRLLGDVVDVDDLGWVWPPDNGVQCYPDAPGKVRRPDVSFVRRGRLPEDWTQEGFLRMAPDLVVEVLSPNDLAYEVDEKVQEYLNAGVRLIWVVNPQARTVRIHRADGSVGWLREADELSGEDVVPGFRCAVRELFPAAAATA